MRSRLNNFAHRVSVAAIATAGVGCLSLGSLSSARAQTVTMDGASLTYNDSTGTATGTTNLISHLTELDDLATPADLLHFIQFDNSHGALTSVTIQFTTFDISSVVTVKNDNSSGTISGQAYSTSDLHIPDYGVPFPATPGEGDLIAAHLETTHYTFSNIGTGQSATSGTLTASASSQPFYTFTTQSVLGQFTGTGEFDQGVYTDTLTGQSTTGGNATVTQVTTASVQAIITYMYSTGGTAPEPSSVALAATFLIPVAAVRYRRSRKP